MKKILVISSLLIFVIFTQNISAQVVIGQPPAQQNQQNNGQQVGYQQTTQYTPEQMKQVLFQQYVKTFFTDAEPTWIGAHTVPDTITSPVSGYKIIRFANGQPVATDYTIPKGAVVARYRDQSTDEYYYSVNEGSYLVKESRYNAVKKEAERKEKQNKKDAKKLQRQNRTPEEKQMVLQRDIMIAQAGYNIFLQVFTMVQQNKMIKQVYGNSGYYNASYGSGPQTINW